MKRLLTAALGVFLTFFAAAQESYLPRWQEGFLDIHTIATGKGDCTYLIMPDGTTMLTDAGDMTGSPWKHPALPDSTRRVAEWIVDYISMASEGVPTHERLDYFLLTHFHTDHLGFSGNAKPGGHGYDLVGVTEVGEMLHFDKIVDRAYPDYDFPSREYILKSAPGTAGSYIRFVGYQTEKCGSTAEKFKVGSHSQFRMKRTPNKYGKTFDIWNIAANGCIAEGHGTKVRKMYAKEDNPLNFDENMFSCAFLVRYGNFYYYNGGDIPGSNYGMSVKHNRDFESRIADAIGHPVTVIKADHHGWKDSCNPYFMCKMMPDAVIIPSSHERHPWIETLSRLCDPQLPGKRILLTTSDISRKLTGEKLFSRFSAVGHIVVRVYEGGGKWQIFVLNAKRQSREIIWKSDVFSTD